ncbi:MAG: acyltransferase [Ignavibacteria bacterium]|nr:acyltransferase [Ignavibacteria bacterium]
MVLAGGKHGKNLKIDGKVFVRSQSKKTIFIGNNFSLNTRPGSNLVGINNFASFQSFDEGQILIGDDCGFTSTVFSSRKSIKVGNNVKIGGNVRVFDHDYHSMNYLERRKPETDSSNAKSEPVEIGDDVFIGTNSIILKGVKIGARSIIGAGSVVSIKNIPEDSLVAGNPAQLIIKGRNSCNPG